jgi:hypothetical protein
MKNREKSKSHPFNTWLLDEKSSEIEIPSLHFSIIGWKILRNRNPIPSMANYWMKNPHKPKSHPSIARLSDEKSSEIEIPSFCCSIIGWKILRNRNPILPLLDYWMKNPQKSKSHPFDDELLDETSREIEIPSLHCSIIGWKIVRNQNPIPSILDYWMKNPQKSKSHPFNTWLLDEKSSEIEIPSLHCLIIGCKYHLTC